ncbi:hypothetical protein [Vibrio jasicida]|uniref:hypothetical protein n=1 Tax=Vibrio jasicida TaxID=766224 RepID=UPI000CE3A96B|nr:hypothetical protein [Vibrio jasicida]
MSFENVRIVLSKLPKIALYFGVGAVPAYFVSGTFQPNTTVVPWVFSALFLFPCTITFTVSANLKGLLGKTNLPTSEYRRLKEIIAELSIYVHLILAMMVFMAIATISLFYCFTIEKLTVTWPLTVVGGFLTLQIFLVRDLFKLNSDVSEFSAEAERRLDNVIKNRKLKERNKKKTEK